MTRTLPAAVDTAVQAADIRAAILLELEFDSGNVNLWTGAGDLTWDSKTWSGMGDLGNIGPVSEGEDLAGVITVTLSVEDGGDLLDLVNELADLDPVGRGFTLYLAFFNADTTIDDVLTLTAGFIDSVNFSVGALQGISLSLASEGLLLGREHFFRMDDAMQQQLFAGDKFFEFVTGLPDSLQGGAAPPIRVGGIGSAEIGTFQSLR